MLYIYKPKIYIYMNMVKNAKTHFKTQRSFSVPTTKDPKKATAIEQQVLDSRLVVYYTYIRIYILYIYL